MGEQQLALVPGDDKGFLQQVLRQFPILSQRQQKVSQIGIILFTERLKEVVCIVHYLCSEWQLIILREEPPLLSSFLLKYDLKLQRVTKKNAPNFFGA